MHTYYSSAHHILLGYPRLLRDEIKQTVPPFVNAAEIDVNTGMVWLISGDNVYEYGFSGDFLSMVYTFVGQYDLTVNSATNRFSTGVGSPMSSPPGDLTALAYASDGFTFIAFSHKSLYLFTVATAHWEYKGEIATP